MKTFDVYPLYDIVIEKAQDMTLWDEQGNEYLDLYGGHAVISIGHSNPDYVAALTGQLQKIGFYSNSVVIPQQQQLAEKLERLSGKKDYRLFLCNSGAEANENALKLASFHNGKKKTIAFGGSFHGRTSLAVAATDNPKIVAPINRTENVVFLPYNDCEALEHEFAKGGVSSVILEAIQGVGGVRTATPEFTARIRELCDRHDAVMIADCVQCGCGRSGKYFALDHCGVTADIYTMAKGIGNGFPLAGLLIAPKFEAKHGLLGTTFGGNYLACAAGIAVADELAGKKLIENAETVGSYLIDRLRAFPSGRIAEVRGRGLMIGLVLTEEAKPVRARLLEKEKIFVGSAADPHVIRLLPSLTITRETADRFLTALKKVLA